MPLLHILYSIRNKMRNHFNTSIPEFKAMNNSILAKLEVDKKNKLYKLKITCKEKSSTE